MAEQRVYRHEPYDLLCGAKALDNGKFEPTLVVSRNAWPSRPRTLAVTRGHFVSAELAIESAHADGVKWIANYG
ncbi:MAG: hypothetical protein IPG93_12870 [Burkholderiales bacterium]|nr:hypothetical protein [Burkholderiales bacterium]